MIFEKRNENGIALLPSDSYVWILFTKLTQISADYSYGIILVFEMWSPSILVHQLRWSSTILIPKTLNFCCVVKCSLNIEHFPPYNIYDISKKPRIIGLGGTLLSSK